jgi:ubiquinone/menaquinone biosynthesis C-methylase UbiE
MLDQARGKWPGSRIRFTLGHAEDIPLEDGSADLVFMSMVFHHFADAPRAAADCRRVLRNGGVAFLRAGTTDRVPRYPYVPFFPTTVPLLYEVLQPCSLIRDTFEAAGFNTSLEDVLVQEIAPTHAAYAEKLAAGADSVLARLSEDGMAEGLARVRAYAAAIDPQPVSEPIDFFALS